MSVKVFYKSDGRAQNALMEMERKLPLVCKVDDLSTAGWVIRRDLSNSERLKRSLKIFAVFFLMACMAVFVPVLHFILPPLLLIGGTVLAVAEYAGTGEMINGEVTCPNCKKVMELPRETEEWPRNQRCTGCSFSLVIDKA
jgi:hypothetical protein